MSDQVYTTKIRLYAPSSGTDVISVEKELPYAPFGISISSTDLLVPFKAVRLSKIRMWCNYRPEKDINGNSISVTFNPERGVRPIEWSDTATFERSAFISKNFSKVEQLGLYYLTSSGQTNPKLQFQMPQGALLELTLDYVLSDGEAVNVATSTSLSSEKIYTNSLSSLFHVVGRVHYTVITI